VTFAKTYGGTGSDNASSVQQTSDGGYMVAGYTESFGAGGSDIFLIKTDASGNVIWAKTYGGTHSDYASSVQQTSDGGYIVAGYTFSFGAGINDIFLIKTDANGNVIWAKTYGGTAYDYAYSVQQTSDGGYIVAGYTRSFGAGGDNVFLIKTDANKT
jgi:ribosomal protein S11